VVPWEKTKDLPKKDWNQLFLALGKMDNWESSESLVKATDWECFTFCSKNIFNDTEFCRPTTSGNIMLNWHCVQAFLVCIFLLGAVILFLLSMTLSALPQSLNKLDSELPEQYIKHLMAEGLTEGKVKEFLTIHNKLWICPRPW
jgi:hypothetical protein